MKNSIRCVLLGDSTIGKTCLLHAYATGTFSEDFGPTTSDLRQLPVIVEAQQLILEITDASGLEDLQHLRSSACSSADVLILGYSIVSPASLQNVQNVWMREIAATCPKTPILLVGLKSDLREAITANPAEWRARGNGMVVRSQGEAMGSRIKASDFIECSSQAGINVKAVFDRAIQLALHRREKSSKKKKWGSKHSSPEERIARFEEQVESLVAQFERWQILVSGIEGRLLGMDHPMVSAEQLESHEERLESLSGRLHALESGAAGREECAEEQMECHELQLRRLWGRLNALEGMADNRGKLTEEGVNSHEQRLATLAAEVERLKVGSAESRQAIAPTSKTECAMRPGQAMDGIISYLAKKHGGNVHTQKIVTVTAKSVRGPRYALFNAVDLASHKEFASNDEPGQWICWDFKDMRVRLTHYTISTEWITLWVLEGSLDGANWIGLHRPPGPVNLATASFAVSEPSQFRFIRLTQTDKNVQGTNILRLTAVEFFGTLFE